MWILPQYKKKVRFCISSFWIWALCLLDLQNMAEVTLCWLLGLGPKKLATASISCLLECSPLEPSHHTVRMCKQSLHRLTRRGTEVPGPKPPLSSQATASNNSAATWRSHLDRDPPAPAELPQPELRVAETSSPCQALPELQACEQNKGL